MLQSIRSLKTRHVPKWYLMRMKMAIHLCILHLQKGLQQSLCCTVLALLRPAKCCECIFTEASIAVLEFVKENLGGDVEVGKAESLSQAFFKFNTSCYLSGGAEGYRLRAHTDLIKVLFPSDEHGWAVLSVSVCSCHPSHSDDRGVRHVLCGLHDDQHVPKAHPITCHAHTRDTPVLLPCLIMWARCLGVSLCYPVALSASIMPLSGRLATAAHSLFLFVSASVYRWSLHPQNSCPLTLESFHKALNEGKEGGDYYNPVGVHINARLKCHSIFKWPE